MYDNHKHTDSIKAKQSAKLYLDKAKKLKDTQRIIDGFHLLYDIKSDKIKYLDSVIPIIKRTNNDNQLAYTYYKKAKFFLYEKREIQKTLSFLNKARNHNSKERDTTDLSYRIQYLFGLIKSEHLNEKKEALTIYKTCEQFYGQQDKYVYRVRHLSILHVIAETYISLKKTDSSSFYNAIGYHKAKNSDHSNLQQMGNYFVLCEGINQHTKTQYKAAIDSISKALPTMINFHDISNIIDSYYYLGKSYYELNQKEKAIPYFIKTDSILESLNSIPQYKHVKTYEYLKNYYRYQGELENQNKYLDKLNAVLEQYLNDQASIQKKIHQDYDIPLLLEEKEELIKKLNTNNSTYLYWIAALLLLLLACGGLIYHQYRKKKIYRLRFEKLMTESKSPIHPNPTKPIKSIPKTEGSPVPEKHILDILEKLEDFEKNHNYLSQGLSSQTVTNQLGTNLKYFSFVINHYKNKNFTQYINELRINYVIKELQVNARLRKYTIKAIAHELGYNSAETFSNAFYKQVKIKPSFYIKELIKKKHIKN
ncbi:helix-turn-helix domain-containing protein [Aquimarina sp. 2201CG1-2-11]